MRIENLQRVITISKDLDITKKQLVNLENLDNTRIWTLNSSNDRAISVIIPDKAKGQIKDILAEAHTIVIDKYNNILRDL